MESLVQFLGRLLFYCVLLLLACLLSPGFVVASLIKALGWWNLQPGQMLGFTIAVGFTLFLIGFIREFHESWEIIDGFYFGLAWSGIAAIASVIIFSLVILIFQFPFDIHWFIPASFMSSRSPTSASAIQPTASPAEPSAAEAEIQTPIPRAIVDPQGSPWDAVPPNAAGSSTQEMAYSVVGLARGDTLNVRNGPGINYGIVARLPNGYRQLHIVGEPVWNDRTEWVRISFGHLSGWVGKQYLTPELR